ELGSLDFIKETVDYKMADKYRGRIRCPDLLFIHKDYGVFVIEVDGEIHDVKVEKTRERNAQYLLAGIKLIVLNLAEIQEDKMTITDYLMRSLEKWKLQSICK
ncbi:MAG: hypothetical protein ACE5H1_02795, partial [Thermodesulfobacteriota bacterium]